MAYKVSYYNGQRLRTIRVDEKTEVQAIKFAEIYAKNAGEKFELSEIVKDAGSKAS